VGKGPAEVIRDPNWIRRNIMQLFRLHEKWCSGQAPFYLALLWACTLSFALVMACLFPIVPCMEAHEKTIRKNRDWPRRITVGSAHTTVYKVKHATNRSGFAYVVSYSSPEGRKTQKLADMNAALEEARIIAGRLAAGRVEGSELSRGEREEYIAARAIVGSHPLISALQEWAHARELCGADLLAAAQSWRDANGTGRKEITVPELVEKFLNDKKRSGVDTSAGYDRTLPRLANAYEATPVHTLTATELKEWLHSTFRQPEQKHVHASTFNSHRRRMVTLWKWARDEGYLPRNAQTEIEQVKPMREESEPIGILKIADFVAILKLIKKNHPTFLAATVLAGFAGLRRAELHAQRWDQIDLTQANLRVTKAKRNTPAMRIVHLCPAAVEWLLLCKKDGELVSPPWGVDRIRAFARDENIPCPDNAFRHSYISYRVAATGNVDETSLEAGNSREVIFQHYRELVTKQAGEQWFELSPTVVENWGEKDPPNVALGKKAKKAVLHEKEAG
jgi:integrase